MNKGNTISTIDHLAPEQVAAALATARARVLETATGCAEWTGSRLPSGYGRLRLAHRSVYAHRFFYEATVGPIPPGLQIDHRCRNRSCVNVAHLEVVTAQENIRRERAVRPQATHCRRGHLRTPENVYAGTGYCKECRRIPGGKARGSYRSRQSVATGGAR